MKYLPLLILLTFNLSAQVFKIDSLPKDGILLDKGWKWHAGDNPDFAKVDFNDSAWEGIDPTKDVHDITEIQDGKIGWLRLHVFLDSTLIPAPIVLEIRQSVASEIYANGQKIGYFGTLDSEKSTAESVSDQSIGLPKLSNDIVIAVRFAFQKSAFYNRYGSSPNNFFTAKVLEIKSTRFTNNTRGWYSTLTHIKSGIFLMMFIIHFTFFIFYRPQKANLFISLMAFSYAIHVLLEGIPTNFDNLRSLKVMMYLGWVRVFIYPVAYIFQFIINYYLFDFKKDKIYWLTIFLCILVAICSEVSYENNVQFSEFGATFIVMISSFYVGLKALKLKKENSVLVLIGMFLSGITLTILYLGIFFGIFDWWKGNTADILQFVGFLAIPITISLAAGRNFAHLHQDISEKLCEVESLSKEKQQILATQNETLEKQVKERTAELVASQNQLIQKEKLASLGELTAGIAHEIQNPLNFVNNFSELSVELMQELSEEVKAPIGQGSLSILGAELFADITQNLQKINHHGKRASNIVKGMLEHSRNTTGERVLTDINQLADEYLRLSFHGMKAKNKDFNADFKTDFDANLPKINVVPQEIGRVLLNLINNAFYAVHKRHQDLTTFQKLSNLNETYTPSVFLTTKQLENQIEIKVADNGNGIPKDNLEKIFQPFFTTKPTGEGTGLGLSLSHDIVTKGHGGTMEVISVEGEGAEFIVKLPI